MATITPENGGVVKQEAVVSRRRRIEVDWETVKRDFEAFGASVTDICARYRIKSRTSVSRMIALHGWQRNVSAIADRMAANSVAYHEAMAPGATRGDRQSRDPLFPGAARLLAVPELQKRRHRKSQAKEPKPAAPASPAAAPPLNRLSQDDNTRLTVLNLAQRQAVVRSQELDGGDVLIGLGRSIAGALLVLVDSDATTEAKRVVRTRLQELNPGKDSMASMAKIAAVLIDGGARLKRRALAMDGKQPDDDDSSMRPSEGPARLILKRLPPDVLMQIRKVAYEVSKLPKQLALPKPGEA